jgi:hypothetical protein
MAIEHRPKSIASKVGDIVSITDRDTLVRVAEFDPAYLQMLRPGAARSAAA